MVQLSQKVLVTRGVIQVINLSFAIESMLLLGSLLAVFLFNLILVLKARLKW